MTLDEYFAGYEESHELFDHLWGMIKTLELVEIVVMKSQVAFRRKKAFAYAWIPGKYLRGRGAPLVLTVLLRRRGISPRWKEIVEPRPGRYTHHMEVYSAEDLDDQVSEWLREAWTQAA
jgi:hypothetical protein